MEELGFQESATLCCTAAVPEPLTDSAVGVFAALLTNEIFADAAPDACGENVIVREAVPPAASVSGRETPLTENSELLTLAEETLTGAVPAESVAFCDWLVPTVTLPKFIAEGVMDNDPSAVALPVIGIESVGSEASELTDTLPLELPLAVGAKLTLKV